MRVGSASFNNMSIGFISQPLTHHRQQLSQCEQCSSKSAWTPRKRKFYIASVVSVWCLNTIKHITKKHEIILSIEKVFKVNPLQHIYMYMYASIGPSKSLWIWNSSLLHYIVHAGFACRRRYWWIANSIKLILPELLTCCFGFMLFAFANLHWTAV